MATVTCNHVPSWQLYVAELVRTMGTYRQVFCMGASTATTIEAVVAAELTEANGYNRKLYNPGTNSYSSGNKRVESPAVNNALVASGTSLQYDSTALIFNGASGANKGFTNANVDAGTNTITVTTHGLANGDAIVLTADAGSTLAGGLTAGTLYYAAAVTSDTFQVSTATDGSAIVDITNAGSGNMRLRYAKGLLVWVGPYGSTETIADGASRTITTNTELHNSGYTVGV
jgi:hypothetical protein